MLKWIRPTRCKTPGGGGFEHLWRPCYAPRFKKSCAREVRKSQTFLHNLMSGITFYLAFLRDHSSFAWRCTVHRGTLKSFLCFRAEAWDCGTLWDGKLFPLKPASNENPLRLSAVLIIIMVTVGHIVSSNYYIFVLSALGSAKYLQINLLCCYWTNSHCIHWRLQWPHVPSFIYFFFLPRTGVILSSKNWSSLILKWKSLRINFLAAPLAWFMKGR